MSPPEDLFGSTWEYLNTPAKDGSRRRVDFLLVWKQRPEESDYSGDCKKRETFNSQLKEAGLEIEEVEASEGLRFVKLHVPMEVLKHYAEILRMRLKLNEQEFSATYSRDKDDLFEDDSVKFSPAARSRIVEFILQREIIVHEEGDHDHDHDFGFNRLVNDGVYLAGYPLHDGTLGTPGSQRQFLSQEWASWKKLFKPQPLDAIRDYYGVKIGHYFAWLGFYTAMLILPSIVAVICLVYSWATLGRNIPALEICGGSMANTTMCPQCDKSCETWLLEEACNMTWYKYLFDNISSVCYGFFMSLWAAVFLEGWKRYSAEIYHHWDVFGFDPEEEHPRPGYLLQLKDVKIWQENDVTGYKEPHPPFWRIKVPRLMLSWVTVLTLILCLGAFILAIIFYRIALVFTFTAADSQLESHKSTLIASSSAVINLFFILAFNFLYTFAAKWLTEKELHRTQSSFDASLTVKIYLFQFINTYASTFYIAFMKGQWIGTPNKYHRLFGKFRQEECNPGGCFMELSIQLAILFMGKQFLMGIVEYGKPLSKKFIKRMKRGNLEEDDEREIEVGTPQHIKDFKLVELGSQGLFKEYLEMVIQYGFITIFATAFPPASLFALLNNFLEIRLDAKKILELHRRPIAHKVRSIGVWFHIMEIVGWISIITNALIIALTSEFIPKTVYVYHYSHDQSLAGYVDFSLSHINMSDIDTQADIRLSYLNATCRYYDFMTGPGEEPGVEPYSPNIKFWHIWLARLLFVIVFVLVIVVIVTMVKLLIPDVPSFVKYQIRRETHLMVEVEKKSGATARASRRRGKERAALGHHHTSSLLQV